MPGCPGAAAMTAAIRRPSRRSERADPLDPPRPRGRDVDRSRGRPGQIVQRHGSAVAEQCGRAAGQDGGHPPAAAGQVGVPDGVDATVDAVQFENAVERRAPSDERARVTQLPRRHDPVLEAGQRGQPAARCDPVRCDRLRMHHPEGGARNVRRGSQTSRCVRRRRRNTATSSSAAAISSIRRGSSDPAADGAPLSGAAGRHGELVGGQHVMRLGDPARITGRRKRSVVQSRIGCRDLECLGREDVVRGL